MADRSYSPIEPPGVARGVRPGAILVGAIVDTLASLVSQAMLLSGFVADRVTAEGGEIPDEVFEALYADPEFLLLAMLTGASCTALGGYVAARRAGTLHVRHGALVGAVAIVVGLIYYATFPEGPRPPFWYDLLAFALAIPAGAAGGLVAQVVAGMPRPG